MFVLLILLATSQDPATIFVKRASFSFALADTLCRGVSARLINDAIFILLVNSASFFEHSHLILIDWLTLIVQLMLYVPQIISRIEE